MNRFDRAIILAADLAGLRYAITGLEHVDGEGPGRPVVRLSGPENHESGGRTAVLSRPVDPRDPAVKAHIIRDLFRQWQALDGHRAHRALQSFESTRDDMACEGFPGGGKAYDHARDARDALSCAMPFRSQDAFIRTMRTILTHAGNIRGACAST